MSVLNVKDEFRGIQVRNQGQNTSQKGLKAGKNLREGSIDRTKRKTWNGSVYVTNKINDSLNFRRL